MDSKPFSSSKLSDIAEATARDTELRAVEQLITSGWPTNRAACPADGRRFWNLRHDLSVNSGIILRRNAVVIPRELRNFVLQRIHDGHLGQTKCLERARGNVFWPGITADIKQLVDNCQPCQIFQHRNPCHKEDALEHERPEEPWTKIGMDIFQLNAQNYLLLVDYTSNYPEIFRLEELSSTYIIQGLKSIFSRHGIPLMIVSDNDPKLVSQEMRQFYNTWGTVLNTSSPYFPQSNGLAERTIQTVKKQLKKAFSIGDDPYLALLAYRTSPMGPAQESPAELLFNRKVRSTVLSFDKERILDTITPTPTSKHNVGDHVNVFSENTKSFSKQGIITAIPAPSSVQVQEINGKHTRRNDRDVRKSTLNISRSMPDAVLDDPGTQISTAADDGVRGAKTNYQPQSTTMIGTSEPEVQSEVSENKGSGVEEEAGEQMGWKETRSGRRVKPPARFR